MRSIFKNTRLKSYFYVCASLIFLDIIVGIVETIPAFGGIEEIFPKESHHSTKIFSQIQTLCSLKIMKDDKMVKMTAHNLFPILDSRRKYVSDRDISTIYEFVTKMSLWHYETSWKIVDCQPLQKKILYSDSSTSSIQRRIFEHTSTAIRMEVLIMIRLLLFSLFRPQDMPSKKLTWRDTLCLLWRTASTKSCKEFISTIGHSFHPMTH